MSLVISFPYRDGLVIASDKRSEGALGIFDDLIKIQKGGECTAVASTGYTLSGTQINSRWRYDFSATDAICKALRATKLNGDIRVATDFIGQALRKTFLAFLQTTEGQLFPRIEREPIFVSRVFHWDKKNRKFQFVTYRMHHTSIETKLELKIEDNPNYIDCFGRSELIIALDEDDERVKGTCDPDMLKIIRDQIPVHELSESQALTIGAYLVWLTSSQIQKVVPGDHSVSATCDVAVIRRYNGFHMLKTNAFHHAADMQET